MTKRTRPLPRHGYAQVTVTVRDSMGFLHHYGDLEAPVGALKDALAILHLQSTAMDAAADETRSA